MGHNKEYSSLQETTNLISYNEDVLALRIKISSLRTIFVTREDKDESPERTRASHPGEQGRVTREDKDESPGRIRTSHPGEQGRVTREDYLGYHERRFWAPKEGFEDLRKTIL